jgi:ACT domain-containing protein
MEWFAKHTWTHILGVAMRAHLDAAQDNVTVAAQRLDVSRATFYRYWGRFKPGRKWSRIYTMDRFPLRGKSDG